MFRFWGSQDQGTQPRPQYGPSDTSYNTSTVTVTDSTPGNHTYNNIPKPFDSGPPVSPTEAASIISSLRDKSVDELRKLLNDKEAYNEFLLSLDQVKTQNNVRDELRKATLQLARENLEKELQITELRNQCRIIRTSELADAQEKLNELERQKEEIMKRYSPALLLYRLQEAMNKTDEESEALHQQFLEREIEVGAFVQKYKKLRTLYHRQALTHLAAKTSSLS